MRGTGLRLRELGFGESNKRHARGTHFAIIRELLWSLVAGAGNRLTGAYTAKILDHFHGNIYDNEITALLVIDRTTISFPKDAKYGIA